MVRDAHLGKEIVVLVSNKIGVLADLSKIISDHGINIEAVAGYADGAEAKIMLVTTDNLRALDALTKSGYKSCKESEVLVLEMENKTGVLKNITAKLASESIDIKYIYGTTCTSGCPSRVILSTSDNEKAVVAFKTR